MTTSFAFGLRLFSNSKSFDRESFGRPNYFGIRERKKKRQTDVHLHTHTLTFLHGHSCTHTHVVSGFKPWLPACQASALSIDLCPSGLSLYLDFYDERIGRINQYWPTFKVGHLTFDQTTWNLLSLQKKDRKRRKAELMSKPIDCKKKLMTQIPLHR